MNSNNMTPRIEKLTVPSADGRRVIDAVLSPVPDYMGVILEGPSARFWHLPTGKRVDCPPAERATAVAFRKRSAVMPSNEVAVAGGASSGSVKRIDLTLGIGLIDVFMPRAHSLAYSHDGRYLAAGSIDGLVRVWDLTGDVDASGRPNPVGKWVKSEHGLKQVWVDGESYLDGPPREVACIKVAGNCVTALSFNVTADLLFVTTASGQALIVNPRAQSPSVLPALLDSRTGAAFDWDVYCVCTHPSAQLVAYGGVGSTVRLVNLSTNALVELDSGVGSFVSRIEFVDTSLMVVVGQLGARVWRLAERAELAAAVAADDGRRLVSARAYGSALFITQA